MPPPGRPIHDISAFAPQGAGHSYSLLSSIVTEEDDRGVKRMFKKLFVTALFIGTLAFAANGQQVYQQFCASCHMANGEGVAGAFPPLVQEVPEYIEAGTDGINYLIHVILFGLQGQITAKGVTYNSMMPPYAAQLSDEQIAALLDYIAKAWGNDKLLPKDFQGFKAEDVARERAKSLTPQQVYEEWKKLEGK